MNSRSIALPLLFTAALAGCTRTEPSASSAAASGGSAHPAAAKATSLTVKGSDTMVILGQRWAEAYMAANAGATVQVTGGGSGTGIAALINGSTDVCQASRPMKAQEKETLRAKRNAEAVETPVALDALAVYVNEKSPVQEISIPQLAKVYLGESTSWKDLGGPDEKITLYGRENNSGTYGYFKEHVLRDKDFSPAVQTLAGTSAVANAVKGDVRGIGYGGIAYLEGVRALKVKKDDASPAIAASLVTAQDGSYPLARNLFFYTAGEPNEAGRRFLEFVKGAAGQKVIEAVGYYPLPKK
jgi:phosphate transport system substrate-binding protein